MRKSLDSLSKFKHVFNPGQGKSEEAVTGGEGGVGDVDDVKHSADILLLQELCKMYSLDLIWCELIFYYIFMCAMRGSISDPGFLHIFGPQ